MIPIITATFILFIQAVIHFITFYRDRLSSQNKKCYKILACRLPRWLKYIVRTKGVLMCDLNNIILKCRSRSISFSKSFETVSGLKVYTTSPFFEIYFLIALIVLPPQKFSITHHCITISPVDWYITVSFSATNKCPRIFTCTMTLLSSRSCAKSHLALFFKCPPDKSSLVCLAFYKGSLF